MSIPTVSAEEVKKSIDSKENITLLDVRTSDEYGKAKILGSINLPVDQIKNKITITVQNKKQTIYVYCLSGSRSNYAVSIMQQLGYEKVYSMQNGLLAWRIKKFPLI